jgi:hypothetical protein
MNKTTSLPIWLVLLANAFVLSSCGVKPSTIMFATQSPTAVPQYIHYVPPEMFNVDLEFDYPGNWIIKESIPYTDTKVISLGDPRFLTLPTPVNTHPIPNDFGSVVIWIIPSKPGQTPDTQVEMLKESYSEHSWMTVLDDYKITIDGYDASVLEYQTNDPETSPSLMFNRRIFFMVKDQMYEIYFTVAEKDRGGEFEKGYEYLFNSLKMVP